MNKLIKRVTIFAALGGALLSLAELQGAVRDPRLDTEAFLDDYLSLDVGRVSAATDVLTEKSIGYSVFDYLLTDGFVSGQTEKTAVRAYNDPIFLENATRLLQQIPEEVFQNPNKGYPLKLNNIDLIVTFNPEVWSCRTQVFKTFADIENRSVNRIAKNCIFGGPSSISLVFNDQLNLVYFYRNMSLVDAPEALTRIQPPALTLGELRDAMNTGSCVIKEGLQWNFVYGAGENSAVPINKALLDHVFWLPIFYSYTGVNNAYSSNESSTQFIHSLYCRDKEGGWSVYIKYNFNIRTLPERTATLNCTLRHKMVEQAASDSVEQSAVGGETAPNEKALTS